MTFLFAGCIKENNNAVSLIDDRKYVEAIEVLSNLLRLLKIENYTSDRGIASPISDFSGLDHCMIYEEHHDDDGLARLREQTENDDLVYTKAIPVAPSFAPPESACTMGVVASIVVFNMALAHHLVALTIEKDAAAFTHKALNLYAMALALQEGQVQETNTLFALAVWNNCGVIYSSMHVTSPQAEQCFGQLLVLLSFFNKTQEERMEGSPKERMMLQGFYHNLHMRLLGTDNFIAAAA